MTILHAMVSLIVSRFLVDEFSDLYYDPTPLREYEKENKTEEPEPQQKTERQSMPPPELANSPQLRRGPHSSGSLSASMPYANSPRHPSQLPPGMPFSGMPPVPASQFYGNGDMGSPSPMRMGGMGMPMDPMGGMGGGMGGMGGMSPMGNMGGMGGMPGMPGMGGMGGMGPMGGGMGMASPDLRRGAMRRGMSMSMDDGFGGLH